METTQILVKILDQYHPIKNPEKYLTIKHLDIKGEHAVSSLYRYLVLHTLEDIITENPIPLYIHYTIMENIDDILLNVHKEFKTKLSSIDIDLFKENFANYPQKLEIFGNKGNFMAIEHRNDSTIIETFARMKNIDWYTYERRPIIKPKIN